MATDYSYDDEFIDVENDHDFDQINQDIVEKAVNSLNKMDEISMDTKNDSGLKKTSQKSLNKIDNLIKHTGTFAQKKLIAPFRNNKSTPSSTDINEKNEFGNILFRIMNKLFSARVVLKRLPYPVVQKMQPIKKPITMSKTNKTTGAFIRKLISGEKIKPDKKPMIRNKIKKTTEVNETALIHEGTAYLRLCPKCKKPPVVRKTQFCHSCKIDLTYECQKCRKQFRNYKMVLAHIDSKCFIRGFYHCSVCAFKTVIPSRVKLHMARLHPSVKINKKTIKWVEATKDSLHECPQCAKKFSNHEFLNRHIPLCNKAQEIIESNPDEQIKKNRDFQKMIIRFCPKCEKDMQVYKYGVSSLKPCENCGSLMKFKCMQCSKQYVSYSSIKNHTKSCDIRNPQKRKIKYVSKNAMDCPYCNHKFENQIWLNRHLLGCKALHRKPNERITYKHLKATCKKCNEKRNIPDRRKDCGKCKSSLHFQCKTCDRNFTAEYDSWCEHLKSYFDHVKYECNECGVGLISRKMLLSHLIICNRENLYCDLCNFTCKLKPSLYRHILSRHPVLNS